MTGRNSGRRSIGETTHTTATSRATFALRGTAGSFRRILAVVTQDGRNSATCRISPSGRREANSIIETQLIVHNARAAAASRRSRSIYRTVADGRAVESIRGGRPVPCPALRQPSSFVCAGGGRGGGPLRPAL